MCRLITQQVYRKKTVADRWPGCWWCIGLLQPGAKRARGRPPVFLGGGERRSVLGQPAAHAQGRARHLSAHPVAGAIAEAPEFPGHARRLLCTRVLAGPAARGRGAVSGRPGCADLKAECRCARLQHKAQQWPPRNFRGTPNFTSTHVFLSIPGRLARNLKLVRLETTHAHNKSRHGNEKRLSDHRKA